MFRHLRNPPFFTVLGHDFMFLPAGHEGYDSSTPPSTLTIVLLLITILVGVKGSLAAVLICISVIANDVEHLLLCFWAIYVSSLEKGLPRSSSHLYMGKYCLFITGL